MVCSKERLDLDEVALRESDGAANVGFAVLASVGALRHCHLAFSNLENYLSHSLETKAKC
jgi:hypothetical protein